MDGILLGGGGGSGASAPAKKTGRGKKAARKRGTFELGPRSRSSSNPTRKALPTPRKKAAKAAPAKKTARPRVTRPLTAAERRRTPTAAEVAQVQNRRRRPTTPEGRAIRAINRAFGA